jgi:YHS domain-containing protein
MAAQQTTSTMVDPVCGADVQERNAAGRSDHHGQTFYFCSLSCKMEFDDNPAAYTRRPATQQEPARPEVGRRTTGPRGARR